jgi:hypothetical protein
LGLAKTPPLDTDGDGVPDSWPDFTGDGNPERFVKVPREVKSSNGELKVVNEYWPDLNGDGQPDRVVLVDRKGTGHADQQIDLDSDGDGKPVKYIDVDGDRTLDGDNLANVVTTVWHNASSSPTEQLPFPIIDLTMIAMLSALVGISGQGGLSNTPISNYTRDQGWGMGHYVGAIPSVVGGHNIQLSHEGTVFIPTAEAMPRWKGWYKHVLRDQLLLWMPACLFGIALPSMLSVQFLKRGFQVANEYETPGMTAGGVQQIVGGTLGDVFWYMTLFCGVLVLSPTMASTIDGIVRRWVDVFWTSSKYLRSLETKAIKYVYFSVLVIYSAFGLTMLSLAKPERLLIIATTIYNFALGFSCWHTLWLNISLLPKGVRPGWTARILLFLAGLFFWAIAIFASYAELKKNGLI